MELAAACFNFQSDTGSKKKQKIKEYCGMYRISFSLKGALPNLVRHRIHSARIKSQFV
jgi:hypothetical protein